MKAEHPTSGVTRDVIGALHRLWCFLFGWIYYAAKGMWGPAVLSFFHGQWTARDHAALEQVHCARVVRETRVARSR